MNVSSFKEGDRVKIASSLRLELDPIRNKDIIEFYASIPRYKSANTQYVYAQNIIGVITQYKVQKRYSEWEHSVRVESGEHSIYDYNSGVSKKFYLDFKNNPKITSVYSRDIKYKVDENNERIVTKADKTKQAKEIEKQLKLADIKKQNEEIVASLKILGCDTWLGPGKPPGAYGKYKDCLVIDSSTVTPLYELITKLAEEEIERMFDLSVNMSSKSIQESLDELEESLLS